MSYPVGNPVADTHNVSATGHDKADCYEVVGLTQQSGLLYSVKNDTV